MSPDLQRHVLGRVSPPPGGGADDVDQFDLNAALDVFFEKAAMTDQLPGRLLDDRPQVEPFFPGVFRGAG
jgi:hypothetical protein